MTRFIKDHCQRFRHKVARGTLFTNGDRDVNFQKGATFKIRVTSALCTDIVNAILEGGLAGKD